MLPEHLEHTLVLGKHLLDLHITNHDLRIHEDIPITWRGGPVQLAAVSSELWGTTAEQENSNRTLVTR